jgi:molybdopterin-guanine dinucleotide biosynthesis adapter protein
MREMRVLGIAGWSGAGKTTLLTKLLPVLVARGLKIATLKHAHHAFDVDTPGKDSWEHRQAGASEVLICSEKRWALMHELRRETEPTLAMLLGKLSPCDLVLVEGFKHAAHAKLEVYRPSLGKPPLYPDDARVLAVATDAPLPAPHSRCVDLNDVQAVADCVLALAEPLPDVLRALHSTR